MFSNIKNTGSFGASASGKGLDPSSLATKVGVASASAFDSDKAVLEGTDPPLESGAPIAAATKPKAPDPSRSNLKKTGLPGQAAPKELSLDPRGGDPKISVDKFPGHDHGHGKAHAVAAAVLQKTSASVPTAKSIGIPGTTAVQHSQSVHPNKSPGRDTMTLPPAPSSTVKPTMTLPPAPGSTMKPSRSTMKPSPGSMMKKRATDHGTPAKADTKSDRKTQNTSAQQQHQHQQGRRLSVPKLNLGKDLFGGKSSGGLFAPTDDSDSKYGWGTAPPVSSTQTATSLSQEGFTFGHAPATSTGGGNNKGTPQGWTSGNTGAQLGVTARGPSVGFASEFEGGGFAGEETNLASRSHDADGLQAFESDDAGGGTPEAASSNEQALARVPVWGAMMTGGSGPRDYKDLTLHQLIFDCGCREFFTTPDGMRGDSDKCQIGAYYSSSWRSCREGVDPKVLEYAQSRGDISTLEVFHQCYKLFRAEKKRVFRVDPKSNGDILELHSQSEEEEDADYIPIKIDGEPALVFNGKILLVTGTDATSAEETSAEVAAIYCIFIKFVMKFQVMSLGRDKTNVLCKLMSEQAEFQTQRLNPIAHMLSAAYCEEVIAKAQGKSKTRPPRTPVHRPTQHLNQQTPTASTSTPSIYQSMNTPATTRGMTSMNQPLSASAIKAHVLMMAYGGDDDEALYDDQFRKTAQETSQLFQQANSSRSTDLQTACSTVKGSGNDRVDGIMKQRNFKRSLMGNAFAECSDADYLAIYNQQMMMAGRLDLVVQPLPTMAEDRELELRGSAERTVDDKLEYDEQGMELTEGEGYEGSQEEEDAVSNSPAAEIHTDENAVNGGGLDVVASALLPESEPECNFVQSPVANSEEDQSNTSEEISEGTTEEAGPTNFLFTANLDNGPESIPTEELPSGNASVLTKGLATSFATMPTEAGKLDASTEAGELQELPSSRCSTDGFELPVPSQPSSLGATESSATTSEQPKSSGSASEKADGASFASLWWKKIQPQCLERGGVTRIEMMQKGLSVLDDHYHLHVHTRVHHGELVLAVDDADDIDNEGVFLLDYMTGFYEFDADTITYYAGQVPGPVKLNRKPMLKGWLGIGEVPFQPIPEESLDSNALSFFNSVEGQEHRVVSSNDMEKFVAGGDSRLCSTPAGFVFLPHPPSKTLRVCCDLSVPHDENDMTAPIPMAMKQLLVVCLHRFKDSEVDPQYLEDLPKCLQALETGVGLPVSTTPGGNQEEQAPAQPVEVVPISEEVQEERDEDAETEANFDRVSDMGYNNDCDWKANRSTWLMAKDTFSNNHTADECEAWLLEHPEPKFNTEACRAETENLLADEDAVAFIHVDATVAAAAPDLDLPANDEETNLIEEAFDDPDWDHTPGRCQGTRGRGGQCTRNGGHVKFAIFCGDAYACASHKQDVANKITAHGGVVQLDPGTVEC